MTRVDRLTTASGSIARPGLAARAPAKVNLTLHVLGRRADGYHELESLVAFAGVADHLTLVPGPGLSLSVEGPTAAAAGPAEDNLVIRALRSLASRREGLELGHVRLLKRLPAAAGIGGGSSDAAAALRLAARHNGLAADDPAILEAARATGADVPVCLDPSARMMRGAGETVGPALPLPGLFAVLANPGVSVPTPAVFRGLGLAAGTSTGRGAHPALPSPADRGGILALLGRTGNDLEAPAIAQAPAIGEALALLRQDPGCRLARMSGSGATVFGLYDDCRMAARAARTLKRARPGWWVRPTLLR